VHQLAEARALQPVVVQREEHRDPARGPALDAARREVEEVHEVHDVRPELREHLLERLLGRREVPRLAEVAVEEVVHELVNHDPVPRAPTERQMTAGDILLRGEHAHVVAALAQARG
jgi:hypothetical protein